MSQTSRHLDLGCGGRPRNPYGATEVFGVDLKASLPGVTPEIRAANLSVAPIPFEANHFDSVSAYDFLEHVPRVLTTADGQGTRFPFVELMNEVWRVLKPGGLFYAITPLYPHASVFQDPTHVNALTRLSHYYFARPRRMASIYGFHGDFSARRVLALKPRGDFEPAPPSVARRFALAMRALRRANSHLLWEFEAHK